jgi:hypothetical protein
VVGFDPVVRVPLNVMPRRRHQLLEHPRVDGCGIGDHLGRPDLQRGQRTLEEPASSPAVATGRHVHVDDLPVLVDGPIDIAPHAADFDVGFVNEPAIAWCVPGEPGRVGE